LFLRTFPLISASLKSGPTILVSLDLHTALNPCNASLYGLMERLWTNRISPEAQQGGMKKRQIVIWKKNIFI
jgi:hypothetical protein